MKTVHKACACVLRKGQILAFRHPAAGNQLVKGTIEADEDPHTAVLRELEEEAGLKLAEAEFITALELQVPGGSAGDGPLERHIWHLFALQAPEDCLESWDHRAWGSADEEGLVFGFFWQVLSGPYEDYHPVFVQAIEQVLNWQNRQEKTGDAF